MESVELVSYGEKDPFEALRNRIDQLFDIPLASETVPGKREEMTAVSVNVSGSD